MAPKGQTIREVFTRASSFLHAKGVEDAKTDAELLLQHVFGWTRSQLFLRWSDPIDENRLDALERLLERRANREPLQYITGEQEFYGLPFKVSPAVLIPRPETELLVEEIMREARRLGLAVALDSGHPAPESAEVTPTHESTGHQPAPGSVRHPAVADIGTGSGAIAVALAHYCPDWTIAAVDISDEALAVALCNAILNRVGERIDFMQGDLLEPVLAQNLAPAVLVSNPPYIQADDLPRLQQEVREYEPWTALNGGQDGLDFYRRILEQIRLLSSPPRIAAFECGFGQARTVQRWLKETGYWAQVRIIRDLAGIERHVIAVN